MLEEIRQNFQKLMARYEAERVENGKLRSELESSRAENESYRKQISGLGQEIETLKLAQAFTASGNDSSFAKEKIEKLIKEIDKCISLLEM